MGDLVIFPGWLEHEVNLVAGLNNSGVTLCVLCSTSRVPFKWILSYALFGCHVDVHIFAIVSFFFLSFFWGWVGVVAQVKPSLFEEVGTTKAEAGPDSGVEDGSDVYRVSYSFNIHGYWQDAVP